MISIAILIILILLPIGVSNAQLGGPGGIPPPPPEETGEEQAQPENRAPTIISIEANPPSGNAPHTIRFFGSGTDPDGDPTVATWDYGDGSQPVNSQNPTKTYNQPGIYTATFTLRDDKGESASQTVTITVTAPQQTGTTQEPLNNPPTARANADPLSGTVPLTVRFNSLGSSDPDGGILTYNWDFGDEQTARIQNPSHTYQSAGQYTVRLTVTDSAGATGQTSLTIRASAPASTQTGTEQQTTQPTRTIVEGERTTTACGLLGFTLNSRQAVEICNTCYACGATDGFCPVELGVNCAYYDQDCTSISTCAAGNGCALRCSTPDPDCVGQQQVVTTDVAACGETCTNPSIKGNPSICTCPSGCILSRTFEGRTCGGEKECNTHGECTQDNRICQGYRLVPAGDSDEDGINDCQDICRNTPAGCQIGSDGCATQDACSSNPACINRGECACASCQECGSGLLSTCSRQVCDTCGGNCFYTQRTLLPDLCTACQENANSCQDYKDETTCLQNPCNVATGESCSWNSQTSTCADLNNDVSNCGAIGNSCNLQNARGRCESGVCLIESCNQGFRNCNGDLSDGCELDARNDPNNCGECGNSCAANNALTCEQGQCSGCRGGWFDFDGDGICANRCEYYEQKGNVGTECCDLIGRDEDCDGLINEASDSTKSICDRDGDGLIDFDAPLCEDLPAPALGTELPPEELAQREQLVKQRKGLEEENVVKLIRTGKWREALEELTEEGIERRNVIERMIDNIGSWVGRLF